MEAYSPGYNPDFVAKVHDKRRQESGTLTTEERIARYLKEGLSSSQIAYKMGMTKGQIINKVRRSEKLKAIGFKHSNHIEKRKKGPKVPREKIKANPIAFLRVPNPNGFGLRGNKPYREGKIPEPVMVEGSLNIPLLDLEPGQCRYATNNAAQGQEHLFCGIATKEGSSYCTHHHRVVYVPAQN